MKTDRGDSYTLAIVKLRGEEKSQQPEVLTLTKSSQLKTQMTETGQKGLL